MKLKFQTCWRRYAVDPTTGLHATWIRYLMMTNKPKYTRTESKSPASSPTVTIDNKHLSNIKRKLQLVRSSSLGERYRNQNSESETREEANEFSIPKIDIRTQRAQSDGDLTFIEQNLSDEENQSTVTSLPSVTGYYGKYILFEFRKHLRIIVVTRNDSKLFCNDFIYLTVLLAAYLKMIFKDTDIIVYLMIA